MSTEPRILLALGRLITIKGFDDLLRAVARLPAEIGGRPWVLLIVGDGPLMNDLTKLGGDLGLNSVVRWLGWQNPPDPYYAIADLFVCPSRHETLGNVILEAWNYALPVVSTMTPGAKELIEDDSTGLLCPCGDPGSLAKRLLEALKSMDACTRILGEAGKKVLWARYNQAVILQDYLELY